MKSMKAEVEDYSFSAAQQEWSCPPVDDVGYLSSTDMLGLSDRELRVLVMGMERRRYGGWRNHDNRWRSELGLDDTSGKRVLDFGCGVGVEALQFARRGNEVILADIVGDNVALAARVLTVFGYPSSTVMVQGDAPFIPEVEQFDVFYANGVLHHTPQARRILQRAVELLRPGGEIRLMLYSDIGWEVATGTRPPDDTVDHPSFWQFVRYFDGVGNYADWYSLEKIRDQFGDFLEVVSFSYLTTNDSYCAVRLIPK